eukprot:scaffold13752_cov23-Tisochrysis_lutea.AAC.4
MRSCGVSAMGVNRTPPVAAAGRGGLPPPSSSQSIHARSVRGGSLSMWSLSAEVAVHAAADSGGTAAAHHGHVGQHTYMHKITHVQT